jgi:hypothetical protein
MPSRLTCCCISVISLHRFGGAANIAARHDITFATAAAHCD